MEAPNSATYTNVRKTFYLILTAILGVVLFFLLEQLLMQGFVILMNDNLFGFTLVPQSLVYIDSLGTILALALGAWYGVWIGSYWYSLVYANDARAGFLYHMRDKFSVSSKRAFSRNNNQDSFKSTTWQLEDLMKQKPASEVPATRLPASASVHKPIVRSSTPVSVASPKPKRAPRKPAVKRALKTETLSVKTTSARPAKTGSAPKVRPAAPAKSKKL